ncbi:uncharacterized protein PG986_014138 [Apiospora aurea]|uniref:Membrane-associated protein n=1 Tax=Apiospora aurea TaxID=335848 RepID=A0ABR1PSL3_9PEZI
MWFSSILTPCRNIKFPEMIAPLTFSLLLVFALGVVLGALITIPVTSAKHHSQEVAAAAAAAAKATNVVHAPATIVASRKTIMNDDDESANHCGYNVDEDPYKHHPHYNNAETPVMGCKNGTRSSSASVARIGHLSLALLESVTAAVIVVALAWDLVIMGWVCLVAP